MSALRRLGAALGRLDPFDAPLRATLLLLLLRPIAAGPLAWAIAACAIAGLFAPRALRSAWLWLALAALTGWRAFGDWPLADNHAYLLAYWCLALGLALLAREPAAVLTTSARLLLGFAFTFAALWKGVLSPDFLDGTFFRVTLLVDPRFEAWTTLVGGVDPEALAESRRALWQHTDGTPARWALPPLPARFEALAFGLTLWTLALEAALGLGFLLPTRGRRGTRDALLILFCATTFVALPTLADFGWLLLAMGLAQCDPTRRRWRFAYGATYVLLLLARELSGVGLLPPPG